MNQLKIKGKFLKILRPTNLSDFNYKNSLKTFHWNNDVFLLHIQSQEKWKKNFLNIEIFERWRLQKKNKSTFINQAQATARHKTEITISTKYTKSMYRSHWAFMTTLAPTALTLIPTIWETKHDTDKCQVWHE